MTLASPIQESHRRVIVPREPTLSRRVAAAAVRMAQRFHSDILFSFGDIHIDAKSTLMAFILLDALKGKMLEMTAHGPDSVRAVQLLSDVFNGNK